MHDKDERIEWETLRFTQVMFSDRRTKVRFDVNACWHPRFCRVDIIWHHWLNSPLAQERESETFCLYHIRLVPNTGLKGREVRFSNSVLTPHTTWYAGSIVSERDKPAMIQGSKSCRFQSVSWRWLLFVKKRYIAFTGNTSQNEISTLLLASSTTRIRRQRGDGRCRHSTETVIQHTHQLKCYRRTSQSALSHDI